MTQEYLFVYGTLRRGAKGEMQQLLARHSDFVSEATFRGHLYRIDYYPGVVPSDDPAHRVKGEVYALHAPATLLSELDAYEKCGPGFAEPTEYIRERHEVTLGTGQEMIAWVYVYKHSTKGLPTIDSGDFLAVVPKEN